MDSSPPMEAPINPIVNKKVLVIGGLIAQHLKVFHSTKKNSYNTLQLKIKP